MTGAVHPTDFRPVVALFCTRGMEDFLSNAIKGILQSGVEAGQIHVGCPLNAQRSVKSVARSHSSDIQVISSQELSGSTGGTTGYSRFGSRSFTDISWRKILFLRQLIGIHPHVVYADLDVFWMRNPLPYLIQVAMVYPIAIQTEGLPRFPPALCLGFVSLARTETAIAFLDTLIALRSTQLGGGASLDDQAACQQLIEDDVSWLRDIYFLPEALFLNGLGYRNLQNAGECPCPIEGELLPFVFHANWTVGIDNKRKLLAATGTWLAGDRPPVDQSTTTGESLPDAARDAAAHMESSPLFTVIFPVFDVRGDVAERVRHWIEGQDLDGKLYRVVVVADTDADLDEASLQRVLRSQDAILRVPGTGREADHWNAGAREAKTPWLLFVEAHGVPQRDSLSALAAWISANPDGEACNFRIENIDGHLVAGLMRRWFADIQSGWAAPSTWRRLHRTAFAIRRDVFEEIGPFEAKYGQFAPPLLSARMDQSGHVISAIPTSVIMHDDAREMSAHHDDTANYVRGEMAARTANDPAFFERYFGPSPGQGPDMIVSARQARSMIAGLVVAALHRPREAFQLLKQTCALWPAASMGLRGRARLLAMRTRADELVAMRLPVTDGIRWTRFLAAHSRLIRTEQMYWIARNPLPSLQTRVGKRRWPIATIGQHAIVGLHALEHPGEEGFRWTQPAFLLRLALVAGKGELTLETRNVRPGIHVSDIVVVAGGRMLSPQDIALDEAGNLKIDIKAPTPPPGEIDIVVIVRELAEPPADNAHGRRLGLPLFSIGFNCAESNNRTEA
ncbi:glycosyltransferase [Bradyrhizobium sediminis]|uniref:Glycosyltransferase n=1 Tax=Bradyrhizobium sediminis TaxID=2840469 RepID=A0A975RZ20_9BRAD|nr:putative nucleotide-diphospho-sugar transferase [Bradyrhizobium sediminis]QWG25019.1 glycosyltransferase [Bradyrhizobium sediminis]